VGGACLAGAALVTALAVPILLDSTPDDDPLPAPTSAPTERSDEDGEPVFPAGEGLTGEIRRMPKAGGFLDRLRAEIVVHNALPQTRLVFDVVVRGWGSVYIDNFPGGKVTVGPGASVALPVTIIPDCGQVRIGMVDVLVRQQRGAAHARVERLSLPADHDPYALLGHLCPRPVPGASVVATTVAVREDGVVLARLVNNGDKPVQVTDLPVETADQAAFPVGLDAVPPLPADLDVGEMITLRMTPVVSGCTRAEGSQVHLVAQTAGGILSIADTGSTSPGLQERLDEAVRKTLSGTCPD
jgi:hypothetical protein